MKNFTKQNFKTNPLWIRLLIMTFMLLIGTSGAWAKYNQPAVDLYFDNSEAQWDNCRVYIGHDKWLAFYNMSRVSGTEHLWKLSSDFNSGNSWNDATHWGFTSDYWEAKEQSVIKIVYTGDKKFTYDNTSTVDENAWTNDKIYKTNGTANVTLDNQTEKAYKITSSTKSNYTVTINSATGGTLTVKDYDNATVSNGDSKIGLTVLKFSASASTGYDFTEVQINNGSTTTTISKADLATKTYTLTSDVTITPVWKSTCPAVTTPTLSIERGITNNCDDTTPGIIAITNYAQFSNCTFTLNDNAVYPTDEGKIEGVTASGSCTVVVTNNCGNSSEPVSIDMPKTTIKAPRTDFTVSLSYPQVAFAENNGSVYIDLSGSERNVTYYLYKDGEKVPESEQDGKEKALRWTVLESGTYTVKAPNPCDDEYIAMNGSVNFTCMSNLNIAFAEDQTTFCPGEKTTVTITFDGTGKGDKNTNPDKYGWQWGGSNYSYESIYLNESGITMPVTINANGSIQLNVKTCNGTLNSNTLNFTVVTAPEKPSVSIGQSTICRGSYTTLTVEEYNGDYTYKLYLNGDLVDAPFNAGVFTISEEGSYQVTASEAECQQESEKSDPRELTLKGPSITQDKETIYPYEVVTFTSNEQVNWYLSINPSTGRELENTDPTYSGKNTAYITKAAARTTTFKGEAANGYQISAAIGDCVTTKTFNVVADPDCE